MNNMERDIVFIDTSIYKAENYFAPNNRILALKKLAEKKVISLVFTEITNREVLKHYKGDVTSALNNIKNNHEVLACFDDTRPLLFKETKKKYLRKCEHTLSAFWSQGYTIGYELCKDVKSVFNKYFDLERPFSEGKKKDEFPDAFVLQMLEQYSNRFCHKKIIVLSNDKDMRDYKSNCLVHVDYKAYITTKLAVATTIDKIKTAIDNEKDNILSDIEAKLEEKLEDGWNYSSMFNTEDLPEIEILACEIDMDEEFSIISKNDNSYLVDLRLHSYCEVKCTYFNLDYATYDREDKIWYGGEWNTETLKGDENFNMLVSYDIKNGDLKVESFEISDAMPIFRHPWE